MGIKRKWQCVNDNCGHIIAPVSGEKDRGFYTATETRVCSNCCCVADYTTGFVSDPTHRVFSENELGRNSNSEPICKRCGEVTVPWDKSCQKCGGRMSPVPGTRVFWD